EFRRVLFRSPLGRFWAKISIRTSTEVLNARVTCACMVTTSPSLIERLKETLSTDTVTTGLLQCFCAAIAEQISIQYNNLPPIKLPKVLVSLGRTSSFISVYDSFAFLADIVPIS